MFSSSARKFHSLLIVPALLPLLMLVSSKVSDNHPPEAVDDSYAVHGTLVVPGPGILANDTDPDGDVLHIGSCGSVAHGTLNCTTQSFTYEPNYGYVGADSFTYQSCDGNGACDTGGVNLSVGNSAPVAANDNYTIHGDTFLVQGPNALRENDSDPEGDPFSVSSYTQTSHGTVTYLFQNGALRYELSDPSYVGTDSFTYQICDNLGLCSSATVTFTVVNSPPLPADDTYTVHDHLFVGGPNALRENDSDPENDPISVTWYTQTAHGTVNYSHSDGSLSYQPNLGYTGSDGFIYNLCDNLGLCATATVTFNVVNGPPVAVNDTYSVRGSLNVPGPNALRANDSDPDSDPFSVTSFTLTAHGTVNYSFSDGSLSYVPNQGYLGVDSFTYQICDGLGACSSATVTLNVLANDGAENAGTGSCNKTVGGPVNVTNGNMYLQQNDYLLAGIGPAINIARTYNTSSQNQGFFGQGWSTDYDESIKAYSGTYVRWFRADGQATNFMRATGSGPFAPVEGDFFGSLIQNGNGTFTVSFTDGSVHRFNAGGKLTALVDRNNNQTALTYNTSGRLTSITDPFARVLTVTTDTSGRVTSLKDALATVATYTYGANSELLSVTYPDSSAFHFAYTIANGRLVLATVTDALGNILETHAYDSQGRAVTSEKQGGVERYTLNFVDNAETDATDALGHVTKYFFDGTKGRNLVTSVQGLCSCGGGSQTQTWTYDDQLNVTGHTNALGQSSTYTYDSNGNQLSGTSVLGTSTFTYNQFGEVLTSTDAMGGVTTNTYDGFGKLLSVNDALNNTTNFTYDARGQLLTMTNPLGKTTTLTWDTSGRLTQTKDALNNLTTFVYDARARLTKATDALANATTFAYDGANRLIKITRADNSVIAYTYDLAGRRTKITDPLKKVTTFVYDGAYRLTGETDALGKSVGYTYDLMSNLTGTTDQLGQTTNIEYDEFNRPKTTIYPPAIAGATRLQQTIEYDAAGNVTRRTDTAGRVTTFAYDAANRLTSVTDPALQVTQYEYNARSNVTAVVDALSQRYEFVYDALSRVTSATRAGLQMSFAYDEVGNRTQRTDYNNMATNYTYDALNRLTKITYPDSSTATYVYDKLSQMTSAANLNGTVSFVYDKLGRVTSTTDVWGQAINYTYDANGRRTKMSFGSTTKATYTYDAINRLTKIADGSNLATTYAYDVASRLTSRTLPNGVVTAYNYDGLDRLTRLKDAKGASVIADNNYTYNDAGNITQNVDQSGTHAYGYDAIDRLTSASYPATGNESYAYDPVGNRTSSQRSASYGYQPFNRLTNTDTAGYLYDNNGNMISKSDGAGTTQFQWDFENRLTQVVTPSAGSVTYKYDALGRRIQSTPSTGVLTNFTYDGDDVAQDKTSTNVITEYLNGPGVDNKIRQKTGTTLNYFAQDHLGSTTALTDSNGALLERETYDAYGNSVGSARTRYGFTGRERDSVTGLMHYRARFYDPQLGRFISEDPIGLAGGVNQFGYVGNNPQNGKDPSGLYELDVHYYLTYFLAMKTGCFSPDEARLIADADQTTDENHSTAPGPGWTEQQQTQNREYHDLKPGNHEGQISPGLWQQAMNGPTNYVGLGRYLHFLQDSFSHAGYTNDAWGHSPVSVLYGDKGGTHTADKTNYDVEKAMRMAGATWNALNSYAKEKKCGCHGSFDPSWWQQVYDFARRPGGDDYTSMVNTIEEDLPVYLRMKREVLDVPWR
jgi:RHS repeat-associated protein